MSFPLPPDFDLYAEQVVRGDADLWKEVQSSGEMSAGLLLNMRAASPGDEDEFSEKNYWQALLNEMRDFLCTDSKKYKADRARLKSVETMTSKVVIPAIAGTIGATLGIAAATLTPFIALALLGIVKIGVNAWCSQKSS